MINFKNLLLSLLFLSSIALRAQTADAILGKWQTEKKDAKIEIYRYGNEYKAKLLWGKDIVNKDGSSKKDVNNPLEVFRKRDLVGSLMIKELVFDEDEWNSGQVYNNANGKWYKCYVWIENAKLHLRGYLGFPTFGQTSKWNRMDEKNPQ